MPTKVSFFLKHTDKNLFWTWLMYGKHNECCLRWCDGYTKVVLLNTEGVSRSWPSFFLARTWLGGSRSARPAPFSKSIEIVRQFFSPSGVERTLSQGHLMTNALYDMVWPLSHMSFSTRNLESNLWICFVFASPRGQSSDTRPLVETGQEVICLAGDDIK